MEYVLNEDGSSLNKDKVMEYITMMESELKGFKEETEKILWPLCSKISGVDQYVGYNWMACVVKNSKQLTELLKNSWECFLFYSCDDQKLLRVNDE
ncbi:uncharacterized protein LOC111048671 isoform X2 [Nilaparvata lugens]|uniref:uncharacterized protein LOC111048671 isoform X2 n=1 Tax=Nilaparvata lugens TaxID=108931 RepID=UPI00193E7F41|nr:uncharacterized protein LOC111048671 isoform X2 [Nilaparvata lugens]